MKKFVILVMCVMMALPAFAAGENVPTSKSFVDYALSQKQDKIPANVNGDNGPDQVLTNTGTPGNVGTKNIYDSSASYADQTDALVDAGTFNAAVQNAINAEFKCISWVDDDQTKDCLLLKLTGVSELPGGYTELEYIEGGVIDTGLYIKTTDIYEFKYSISVLKTAYQFGYRGASGTESPNTFSGTWGTNSGGTVYIVDAQSRKKTFSYSVPVNTPFVFRWNGSVDINPTVSSNIITSSGSTTEQTSPTQTFMLGGNFFNGKVHKSANPMKLYYFKTFDNNGVTVTHNFIPARRDSDGVLGMYDTISKRFLQNAASGQFTAGPVVNLYLPHGN